MLLCSENSSVMTVNTPGQGRAREVALRIKNLYAEIGCDPQPCRNRRAGRDVVLRPQHAAHSDIVLVVEQREFDGRVGQRNTEAVAQRHLQFELVRAVDLTQIGRLDQQTVDVVRRRELAAELRAGLCIEYLRAWQEDLNGFALPP